MEAKLMMRSEQTVVIPDLSAGLVAVCADYGAEIMLDVRDGCYDEGGTFYELYVTLTEAGDEARQETFEAELSKCEGYDESKMYRDSPYFQSDGPDGEEVFETFIEHTKKMYPNFKFS